MRVEWAMFVRRVEVGPSGWHIEGGGLERFDYPTLPVPLGVAYAIQFRFRPSEVGTIPAASYEILDEASQPVADPEPLKIPMLGLGPHHPPGWDGVLPCVGRTDINLERYGTYTLHVTTNAGSFPLPFIVLQRPPA